MKIISKYGIILRLVEVSDAEFILNLRTNPKLSTFISDTSTNILDQIKWIQNYKVKEMQGQEYYYIAQDQHSNKYGTIRLYDFDEKSFILGSWIFLPNSPIGMAVKTHFIGIETGFELINGEYCRITVNKKNTGVLRYLADFKPTITYENDVDLYLTISKENFFNLKNKISIFS